MLVSLVRCKPHRLGPLTGLGDDLAKVAKQCKALSLYPSFLSCGLSWLSNEELEAQTVEAMPPNQSVQALSLARMLPQSKTKN